LPSSPPHFVAIAETVWYLLRKTLYRFAYTCTSGQAAVLSLLN
jgi:hypothetical protein